MKVRPEVVVLMFLFGFLWCVYLRSSQNTTTRVRQACKSMQMAQSFNKARARAEGGGVAFG